MYGDVRDTFGLAGKQPTHTPRANMTHMNVVVTCVAWSPLLKSPGLDTEEAPRDKKEEDSNSIIAAAGSNGVIVVWSAKQAFFSEGNGSPSSVANQQPEATLNQHSRAVNGLAWHPKRSGLLLTASQVSAVD